MSRERIYNNLELVARLQIALKEFNNVTRLQIALRNNNDFRIKYGLDQNSVDAIFAGSGNKAPQIQRISLPSLKSALNSNNDEENFEDRQEPHPKIERVIATTNPPLRNHQTLAIEEIKKAIRKASAKGRIILPTGTGKTRIEAEAIVELINKNSGSGIYVTLTPRILLTYQLLDNISKIVSAYGIECDILNVNSGDFDSVKLEKTLLKMGINPQKIDSTTNVGDIRAKMTQANNVNKPLLIFSTYHSVDRVDEAATQSGSTINLYNYDEAQYCVTSGDFQNVPYFDSDYKFFFTATEKYTDDAENGIGMNNENIFGKIIYTEKPRSLIEQGEMASVAFHLVGSRENIDNSNYESKARITIEAFDKHRDILKQFAVGGSRANDIGPKMLVVCDSQDSLKGIMQSKAMKQYRADNKFIKIYALSSDFGIEMERFKTPRATNKDKEELFNRLNELEDTDESIIFHVDMLGEGIDVTGITAVLPFRNLSKIKFLQNLGRGTRLVDIDRAGLYNKSIYPKNWEQYIKPYCWVILPVISSEYYDFKRRVTNYIQALRSDYDFDANDIVVVDNIFGPPEDDAVHDITGVLGRKFNTGKDVIDEVIHSIEDSEAMTEFMNNSFDFKKLKEEEQMNLLTDIFKE